jgi:hypothetical protein
MADNKQALNGLFELFKKLASFVFEDLFRAVDYALDSYISSPTQELAVLANLLFLLADLVDRNFIERNVNMNRAKDQEVAILAGTVKKASFLAQEYASNRGRFAEVKDADYLDTAVLIFCESILIEFLSAF